MVVTGVQGWARWPNLIEGKDWSPAWGSSSFSPTGLERGSAIALIVTDGCVVNMTRASIKLTKTEMREGEKVRPQ